MSGGRILRSSVKAVKRTMTIRRFRVTRESRNLQKIDAFFRHPMVLLLAGFFLTAIVGGSFSYWRESRDRSAEQARSRLDDSREAIDKLSQVYSEFDVRAQILLRGINAAASSNDLKSRKVAYDEEFVKAKTVAIPGEWTLNRIFPPQTANARDRSGWPEATVRYRFNMLTRELSKVDECIENAYEKRTDSKAAPEDRIDCGATGFENCSSLFFRFLRDALETYTDPAQRQGFVEWGFMMNSMGIPACNLPRFMAGH